METTSFAYPATSLRVMLRGFLCSQTWCQREGGEERPQLTLSPQERDATVAIMQVVRGGCDYQQAVVRVGQYMALVADDGLGGIVPTHALDPDAARAHGVHIKDGPRRTGLAPDLLAICQGLGVRQPLEHAGLGPVLEPAVHHTPEREVERQLAQGAAGTRSTEDAIEHGALRPQPWAACSVWGGQQLREQNPINVAQAGYIKQGFHA